MDISYSRRDFIKMMGVGAAGVVLGISGCSEVKEDTISTEELEEYHIFKQNEDNYLFLREQRYLDNYMYIGLYVVNDENSFANAVFVILPSNEEMDLDNGIDHIEFSNLVNEFGFIDLGNAVDMVSNVYGNKEEYKASEIGAIPSILKEKDNSKILVKKN